MIIYIKLGLNQKIIDTFSSKVTCVNKRQRKPKGQSRDIGNIGHTNVQDTGRRQTKYKKHNTTQITKKMSNTDPNKNRG
jgi:hypothetical protein